MYSLADLVTRYAGFATNVAVDLVAILLMTYALYFRRHWRSDLLLSYITLNVGIFVVMSILSTVRVDIAVGFGLFAILSIIRLRSSAVTQQEVAYYFVALVLGLINGINLGDRGLLVAMNVLLLAVMFVFDSRPLRERAQRVDVQLDKVYTDKAALVAELEHRLNARVVYHEVSEIDLIHHHMTVDVRFRTGPGFSEPRPDGQPLEAAKKTNGVAPATATGTGTGTSPGGGGLARHASE
jgi:hypothetical protein